MSLALAGVRKTFGSIRAVDNITLDVKDGEFLSLVGPSGCGKTTLLRLIAGFLSPDEGHIRLDDSVVNGVPARQRGIGMVFQNYALFPNLTVYDNVAFGLRARKVSESEIRPKVMQLIEMVGIGGRAEHYPRQLSGGQQQRTALARALAISPKVLLLDEPLSALDAKVRLNLRYELRRIQKETNITAVYVTHDQEEALSISDRVAVMQSGRLEQIGTPRAVYAQPVTRFVADFIGISNLLSVEPVDPNAGALRWRDQIISGPHYPGRRISYITIRPEDIRVVLRDSGKTLDGNSLEGVVRGRVFLGSIVRLAVEAKGERLVVDVGRELEAELQVDQPVILSFDRYAVGLLEE